LLISAIGIVPDIATCVTMDFKEATNKIVLVGLTRAELGGSVWSEQHQPGRGEVPRVDSSAGRRIFGAVHAAIKSGLVRACHDLSEGGLAVAVAEMAVASGLGASIELADVPRDASIVGDDHTALLFSESPSRFLLEVRSDRLEELERLLSDVPHATIGVVTSSRPEPGTDAVSVLILVRNGKEILKASIEELKSAWQSTFKAR
jgi:phosphoribosylformylglycinamidine synthase